LAELWLASVQHGMTDDIMAVDHKKDVYVGRAYPQS